MHEMEKLLNDRREYSRRNFRHLQGRVWFEGLVLETHQVDGNRCVVCPNCNHKPASCEIQYPIQAVRCSNCGWTADHVGWLMKVRNLTMSAAFDELEARAGHGHVPRF